MARTEKLSREKHAYIVAEIQKTPKPSLRGIARNLGIDNVTVPKYSKLPLPKEEAPTLSTHLNRQSTPTLRSCSRSSP